MLSNEWTGPENCESSACVEARVRGSKIEVRNSTDPAGPSVKFTKEEWREFIGGVHAGDFDLPE